MTLWQWSNMTDMNYNIILQPQHTHALYTIYSVLSVKNEWNTGIPIPVFICMWSARTYPIYE